MEFRKDEILFWEEQVLYYFGLVGCVAILWNDFTLWPIFVPILVVVIGLLISGFWGHDEWIMINSQGISCRKGKHILWECEWAKIQDLQIGRRYRNPSIEIILYATNDEPKRAGTQQLYFQLSFRAKKAVKAYYGKPLSRMK